MAAKAMLPAVDAPMIAGVERLGCVKFTVASEPANEVLWGFEVRLARVPGEDVMVVKLAPDIEAPPPIPNVVVVVLNIASVSRICDVQDDVVVATTGVSVVEHGHGSSMVV